MLAALEVEIPSNLFLDPLARVGVCNMHRLEGDLRQKRRRDPHTEPLAPPCARSFIVGL